MMEEFFRVIVKSREIIYDCTWNSLKLGYILGVILSLSLRILVFLYMLIVNLIVFFILERIFVWF